MGKAAKHRRPAYLGRITFDSIQDPATGTNNEHVKLLLEELPWMRAAALMLNMNDVELEAKIRAADKAGADEWMTIGETLVGIEKRWRAGADMCRDAASRILIVVDRCYNGPRPAPWAFQRKVAK